MIICPRCADKLIPSHWTWNNGHEELIICLVCSTFMPGDRDWDEKIIYYRETGIERYFREQRICT